MPPDTWSYVVGGTLTYFLPDIISGSDSVFVNVTMDWDPGHGYLSIVLPPRPDNSFVKFRVTCHLMDGSVSQSPYPLEPYKYWGYFVAPPQTSQTPVYNIFLHRRDWGILWENIDVAMGEERVNKDGCTIRSQWSETVPAIVVHEGEVIDARVRYQGSEWNRKVGDNMSSWIGLSTVGPVKADGTVYSSLSGLSWKIKLPDYGKIGGHKDIVLGKMHQGCTMFETPISLWISETLGLATAHTGFDKWFVKVNLNGFYYRYMWRMVTDFEETVTNFFNKNCLDMPLQETGIMWKTVGSDQDEGPFGMADFRILEPHCNYSADTRYTYTYKLENGKNWGMDMALRDLIVENSVIKNKSHPVGWLESVLDVDLMLNYHTLINFAGTWDQTIQNQFIYRRIPDNKWFFILWDCDGYYEAYPPDVPLNLGALDSLQPHYLRNNILQYLQSEWNDRMRLLIATVFSPSHLTKLFKQILEEFNMTEATYPPESGWSGSYLAQCLSDQKSWITNRVNFVNSQLGTWQEHHDEDPWSVLSTIRCPDTRNITRTYVNQFKWFPGMPPSFTLLIEDSSVLSFVWSPPNSWSDPITGYEIVGV
eukprot:TRINITY_DN10663_c0_g1_i7.p1 TRINITY_DN10663_c0_g1~~TRINITY_DN10663_c0_g1_i7.p1  ORF type:complete len:591 (-),score=108.54 TRINITY_DN10663_c0_g1_i7:250-2022(-)